ncbi:GmrSD restriction endonuclease domain-containing protein [Clostridium tyrobutyricum]|uniref:GmrSD restriction endonuclease domain-containing protein n=1 Tax=Clostridium tyrobutyricum TaxID=1519 RepID=UPI0018AC3B3F|nr:DUF262 domain-containing protein [Clostridium tyrobutyricum]
MYREQPQPDSMQYSSFVNDIDRGNIKIPQFQREFVWSREESAKLIDSIIKGYPIGTFILWKTRENLRSIKNIGAIELPTVPEGDYVEYILDGQQRMTSIYASLKGVKVKRKDNKLEDFSEMYIDLLAEDDEDIVITDISEKDRDKVIKLRDLLYGGIRLLSNYADELQEKLEAYKDIINRYNFSCIFVKECPIDIATEIFTRINVGGKSLSVFEIMVAKTYDSSRNFDLAEKYDKLIEELSKVEYSTVPNSTILQTISVLLVKDCTKKQILKLDKQKFIDIWNDAAKAIQYAVDYFRGHYRIPVSRLLPYNTLIVPFSYFFYKNKTRPNPDQEKRLEDYFWRCSLSERFSSAVEAKLANDIKIIDAILNDEPAKYDYGVDISPQAIINNGYFSTSRSYIKAILSLYAYMQPKSFNDNSIVHISNDWLRQANSKNYHHIFPKAYMKKQYNGNFEVNHILNIAIVDDFLNKRLIGDKAPSKYMSQFKNQNKEFDNTMKTHLIGDLDKFGILEDDYDLFIHERSKLINDELKKRIIKQTIDTV